MADLRWLTDMGGWPRRTRRWALAAGVLALVVLLILDVDLGPALALAACAAVAAVWFTRPPAEAPVIHAPTLKPQPRPAPVDSVPIPAPEPEPAPAPAPVAEVEAEPAPEPVPEPEAAQEAAPDPVPAAPETAAAAAPRPARRPAAPKARDLHAEPPPDVVIGVSEDAASARVRAAARAAGEAARMMMDEPETAALATGAAAAPAGLDGPRDGVGDDLTRIRGLGPKLETALHALGVWHFDQIAGWTPPEVAWIDANLGGITGQVARDGWVEQARALATGGGAAESTGGNG